MTELPADLVAYKTTPVFEADTVPKALTKLHRTAAGVWGRIEVFKGALDLIRYDDQGQEQTRDEVSAGNTTIISPREPHAVWLHEGTAFSVTFFRKDSAMAERGGG